MWVSIMYVWVWRSVWKWQYEYTNVSVQVWVWEHYVSVFDCGRVYVSASMSVQVWKYVDVNVREWACMNECVKENECESMKEWEC